MNWLPPSALCLHPPVDSLRQTIRTRIPLLRGPPMGTLLSPRLPTRPHPNPTPPLAALPVACNPSLHCCLPGLRSWEVSLSAPGRSAQTPAHSSQAYCKPILQCLHYVLLHQLPFSRVDSSFPHPVCFRMHRIPAGILSDRSPPCRPTWATAGLLLKDWTCHR